MKKGKVMVVANPIYDTVFKFLMEDERIARTILSALLKRDIEKVEVRPHEYVNATSQHMLDLDDSLYDDDDVEMQRILRKLLMAASDADMRMDMNVEDEYFSIIERLDTDLLLKDQQLKQQGQQIQASVKLLHKTGMSPEDIAASLNMSIETVRKILS